MRLSLEDYRLLETVLGELYEVASTEMLRQRMMRIAARLVDSHLVSYNEQPIDRSLPPLSLCEPAEEELRRLFPVLHALIHEHPVLTHGRLIGRTGAMSMGDCMPRRELRRLSLYNEYYRKIGTTEQLVLFLEHDPAVLRTVSISRSRKDFTQRDRTIMNHLKPHMERACRNAEMLDRLNAGWDGRTIGEAGSGREMLSIRVDGTVEFYSGEAGSWLREAFGQGGHEGMPAPLAIREWIRVQKTGPGCGFEPLILNLKAARITCRIAARTDERAMVIVERLPREAGKGWSEITSRERDVLSWVVRGKSNPEIAIILGISHRTVEKHMEAILSKLGLENRAGVMLAAIERGEMVVERGWV